MQQWIYLVTLHTLAGETMHSQICVPSLMGELGYEVQFVYVPEGTYRVRVQHLMDDGSMITEQEAMVTVESCRPPGAVVHVLLSVSTNEAWTEQQLLGIRATVSTSGA